MASAMTRNKPWRASLRLERSIRRPSPARKALCRHPRMAQAPVEKRFEARTPQARRLFGQWTLTGHSLGTARFRSLVDRHPH